MSHLRLTTSDEPLDELPSPPNAAAVRFAAFTPMNEQPALADRKATFVIGAGGLLLSTMLFLITPLAEFARAGPWPALPLGLALALSCVTLVAMRTAYRCYTLAAPPARSANPLFFQNIALVWLPEYAGTVRSADSGEALRHVVEFNHTMAVLAAEKYRLAGRALTCLRVAIPLWIVLLTVIAVRAAW